MPRHQPLVHANSRCWLYNETSILILDHSKFDQARYETICPLAGLDHLVSDRPPPRPLAEAIARAGVALHLAPVAETAGSVPAASPAAAGG